jgi:signal transduction histidine kinase
MLEEFLTVLSHELKQPLNLIHLNAELRTILLNATISQDNTDRGD